MEKKLFKKLSFICFLFLTCISVVSCFSANNIVRHFDIQSIEDTLKEKISSELFRKRREVTRDTTDIESQDGNDDQCRKQQEHFDDVRKKLEGGDRLEETHTFENETKYNLALAWAGENDDGTLLVLTTEYQFLGTALSTLWRSTNHGRTWVDWSDKVDNRVFRKNDGLQRNPHNPRKVYLVSYEHFIYTTEDGGKSFYERPLTEDEQDMKTISVGDTLVFHPSDKYEDYVAIISNDRKLYLTYDNFHSKLEPIQKNVQAVKWGTEETSTAGCLFATIGNMWQSIFGGPPATKTLMKYDRAEKKWTELLDRVHDFNIEGKFMYASQYKDAKPSSPEDERLMMISSDGGKTWGRAQLPTVIGDRFFSVMDMSESLIFIHVDNPGDTGHGVLYTSSSRGLVYSESLKNHLYPNYNNIHDFYKVDSMRGVYLASQMGEDKSIHTVISYNYGGEWKQVPRPLHAPCENDEKDGCYLQVHNAYSIHRGIQAQRPHSQKEAYGIVFVHGHVAKNIQTTAPDVYLSTDGGYNFRKVLKGPHAYEIADSGGLLIAIELKDPYPNTIKFSTDEGHCWHTYKFTDRKIKFTGLLTEPGGKSMTVSVWGYTTDAKKWTLSVIDFNKVVTSECKEENYIQWIPHTALSTSEGKEGCLLGKKETYQKIKADSWCRNGYNKHMKVDHDICTCSEDDFECDYGFFRDVGKLKCLRQKEIPAKELDICLHGKVEELLTIGYRKVPGDVCENGFQPKSQFTDLDVVCRITETEILHNEQSAPENTGSAKLVVLAIGGVVLAIVGVIGSFFLYKMVLLRRHKVVYRYSMLNQNDDEFENRLNDHDTLYKDSSDEEGEKGNSQHQPTKTSKNPFKSYHDDSDDDMLG